MAFCVLIENDLQTLFVKWKKKNPTTRNNKKTACALNCINKKKKVWGYRCTHNTRTVAYAILRF